MSSTPASQIARGPQGRFQTGNIGGGRPRGSRNKLGEAFIRDVEAIWNERGAVVLRECAESDPAAFCRIVAGLLPRDVDISVVHSVDPRDFANRFQAALALLDNVPSPRLPKALVLDAD
jgi:hypothetical protein